MKRTISVFNSFIGIPVGITSSAVGLKISVINTGIEMHKPISKKIRKKKDVI